MARDTMLNKIGNKNFTLLSKMLDMMSAQQRVVSQNVANVDTPNYRRREFKFDQALRQAMDKGTAKAYSEMRGWVARPKTTPVRNNGNNVDIDMEMQTLNFTSQSYQVYSELYNKKSQMVKQAIRGAR